MTQPAQDNIDELRTRWLNRYMSVQGKADTKIRTALIAAAETVYRQIIKLDQNKTFSAGVKSAQLRLVMQQVQSVHNDLFGKFIPIINDGSQKSATAAITAFSETDKAYLAAAFKAGRSSASVGAYIASQQQSAARGVAAAVTRITKSDRPLSLRVYRTKNLANIWVKNQVNSAILRNASAKEIALTVRSSIRPSTSGGVSYAALRLGRTELNNAFHATAIEAAQDRPWVTGMDWYLSKTHEFHSGPLVELCEVYASQKTFSVDHVPAKPHPQCRCFVAPEVEPLSVFITHLTAGQYRDWIEENAA